MALTTPKYQVVLADSPTMTNIADLTYVTRGKSLNMVLNRPGTFTGEIPLEDELAKEIVHHEVDRCIKVFKDDVLIWSGPLWQVGEDTQSNRVSISAVGWFSILHERVFDVKQVHGEQNAGEIAFLALDHANAQRDTWISRGTNGNFQARTRTFEQDAEIGQAIQEMSEIENGFDFYVDPGTRQLHIDDRIMTDRPEAIFGYAWGPNNVQKVARTGDAAAMGNRYIVTGKHARVQADHFGAQAEKQLFTKVVAQSEVTDTQVLAAFANAEVAINAYPRRLVSFIPFAWTSEGSVPRLFFDYGIGDKIYLSCDKGTLRFDKQAVRVFGATIGIDEAGKEALSEIHTTVQA